MTEVKRKQSLFYSNPVFKVTLIIDIINTGVLYKSYSKL